MPAPGTYATVEEAEESRKRFPQYRFTFDAKTQDLMRRIQNAPSQQALAKKPAAPKSFLQNALEMPSRPLQATASAIGYGLSGRDPLQGAWQGLQGQSGITGMADVLEQQGVPELGRLQLGPLDIKGRDVAGFGLDIAADPLTFAGGKLLGLAGKGGEAVARGAGGVGTLAPTISERMATDFAPSGVGKLVQAATKLPGVEGIGRLIDRRPFAKLPAEQMSILHGDKMARRDNIATRVVAPLAGRMPFKVGEHGGVVIKEAGKDVEYGVNDVAFKLGDADFVKNLKPEQVSWVKEAADLIEPLHEQVLKATGGRFALREIEEGGQYLPSRMIKQAREFGEYEKIPVGGAKTFEKERKFASQREGMAAGRTYADPVTMLYQDVRDSLAAIYDGELRTALKGIGKEVDVSQLVKLQGQLKTAMLAEKNIAKHAALKKQYDEVTAQMGGVGEKLAPWEMESAVAREFAESGGHNFVNPFPGFANETVLKVANKHGLNPYESSDWADGVLRDKSFREDLQFERKASGLTPDRLRMAAEEAATRGDVTEQYRQLGKLKTQLGGRMATAEGRVLKQVESAGAEKAADVRPLIAKEAKRIENEKATLEKLGLVPVKGQPFAKNILLEPSDAKIIEEYIGKKAGPGWKKASDVVGVMRTMSSNLDMGAGFLQGLPLLARNPIAWGRAQAAAFKTLADPKALGRYQQTEKFQRVHSYYEGQLATANPEFTGAMTSGQIGGLAEATLGKVPKVGETAAKGFTGLMGRFSSAFDAFGVAARTEMGDAMMGVAESSGKKREVAELINHLTGVSEPAAWGLSPNQRAIESTVLFFSPRYTRATLAVIGDLTRADAIGDEARKTMAAMLIGGVATYYKLANMMNQEPNLDPSSSRFLSLQVGSEQVGVGSVWMSMARLLGKSIANPLSLKDADPQNPLIAWWRSRSAPVGQVIADLVTQENYFGEPIGGPVGLAKETAKKGLPFALQSFLEQPGPQAGTIPAQLLGLNVNPQNYFERREGIAGKVGGAPYAELTPFQQQEVSQKTRDIGLPIRGDEQQQQADVFDAHQKNMKTIADRVERGIINKQQYKEQRQDAYTQLAVKLQTLKEKFPKTAEEEQKRWDRMSLREQARDKWLSILATKDEAGEPQYEEADAFLSGLPKEIQDYVDDVGTAAIGNLPKEAQALETELRNARRTLRPYWQIAEDVMKQRGIYDDYQAMNPAEQAKYERTAKYKLAEKIWERRRQAYKRGKPDVQRALEDWYGYAPKRRLAPLNPSGIAA